MIRDASGQELDELLIPADEVQVWVWRCVPVIPNSRRDLLSEAEHSRAARFAFERDRVRFIAAHVGLRLVLGGLLGTGANMIRLIEDENGKPRIAGGTRPPLFFNLSHSHELAAVAVSASFEVGLDIERLRPADLAGVVSMFSQGEQAALKTLPASYAFDVWTRKEAYMKAIGVGLTLPLDSFEVSVGPDKPVRLVKAAGAPEEAARWQMLPLVPADGYVGAVAARALGWHIVINEITLGA